MVKTSSAGRQAIKLSPERIEELQRVAAMKAQPAPAKDRIIISGQVEDNLVPYVRSALAQGVSKTDLINLALATYFEVEVYKATAVA